MSDADTLALARMGLAWIEKNVRLADATADLMLADYRYSTSFYVHFTAKTRASFDDLVARIPWGPADLLDEYPIPEAGVLKHTGAALGGRVIVTCAVKDGEQ